MFFSGFWNLKCIMAGGWEFKDEDPPESSCFTVREGSAIWCVSFLPAPS